MQIISSGEFRANQKKYFEMAENETVLITRRNRRPITLRATTDEELPSPAELASLQRGLDDVRKGRVYEMRSDESLDEFLARTSDEV
ncbi:MAG: prevent-host-death protein [Prevotellaceae bacterium]|jgi:PHD/YefM family antitoxin component YafN of YafNO toxin-antitoxin module|nr:prevent-host-death protein [Prevotellaceae bacterium]